MFDKFGEMNSYEEINELAMNLANEGDANGLALMLAENGLDKEVAALYMAGELDEVCDAAEAAIGKLSVEAEALKLPGESLIKDWIGYIEALCMEDEDIAVAVRRKDRHLSECLARILDDAFRNQWTVPQNIVKASRINANRVTFGIPGTGKVKKIIKAYYLGARS